VAKSIVSSGTSVGGRLGSGSNWVNFMSLYGQALPRQRYAAEFLTAPEFFLTSNSYPLKAGHVWMKVPADMPIQMGYLGLAGSNVGGFPWGLNVTPPG